MTPRRTIPDLVSFEGLPSFIPKMLGHSLLSTSEKRAGSVLCVKGKAKEKHRQACFFLGGGRCPSFDTY